ncbi:PepSY domain-containing protein [Sphingopyxis sp. XHP0097]|uniref:PepSY domain-containing protein n=1 Tax=Sphingopyxis jiangsuensis TaxID=2871171 RepID=A0ABS7MDL3_9SPHN|nr:MULTISPECIES: PepSY domain-containing protein [Sphingopyxis]MBY4636166.1 PepSY domain-containing protein [Sphingopyxis jiangsuensis]
MKPIRLTPLFFRRIHKWVGLILGIQFLLWALSGSVMALLDKDAVGGHGGQMAHTHPLPEGAYFNLANLPDDKAIVGIVLRDLGARPVYEIRTRTGVQLFDATSGDEIHVDGDLARHVASMMNDAPIRSASVLPKPNLEARDHEGAMWRIDFDDEENSSAYVSLDTARFLVMRGDTWRTWDFFWMLHNMDYIDRKSFNHPLIIFMAFGVLWLSGTGFYLLFKSFSRADFRWLRRRRKPTVVADAG